jgi:hypothetical protein
MKMPDAEMDTMMLIAACLGRVNPSPRVMCMVYVVPREFYAEYVNVLRSEVKHSEDTRNSCHIGQPDLLELLGGIQGRDGRHHQRQWPADYIDSVPDLSRRSEMLRRPSRCLPQDEARSTPPDDVCKSSLSWIERPPSWNHAS